MTTLDSLVPDPPRPGPRVAGADGVEVATWDFGGSGPPILLVHATGFHAWTWIGAAAALRSRHRVWALDQRGHGTSDPSPSRSYLDWSSFASDLHRVVDALGLERPVAAGHSLGGAALLMAEQRRPGTFSALHCFEPIVIPPGGRLGGPPTLADGARRRRTRFASADAAVANFRSKAPLSILAPGIVEAYVAHGFADQPDGSVTLRLPGPEEATVYEGAPRTDIFSRLGEVQIPVTVAGGDLGPPGGPGSIVDLIAERLPAGRSQHFATLGHFGPMEDPQLVADAIAAAVTPAR
ncbi:alpha/beta hydrolase [Acidiferrimicrobium sp. IK]|uniref:alpha/beta fold hydrolase n=1 Tax=Acidiferrimicrobium sp. IK TaxID=2871700 RepID=UPI0021CB207F|nr:alpha/beta hydrolase [Acidiferrimicrobium sp. IK]MCU4184237.1 alpha/beta hydrolase [Acidiferrimicrobium sp. IK]